MRLSPQTLLLLTTTLLPSLTTAQDDNEEVTSANKLTWPWDVQDMGLTPNATATTSFKAYNITRPFEAAASDDPSTPSADIDWDFSVEVYADIEMGYNSDEDQPRYGTGRVAKISAPESLMSENGTVLAHDDWVMCWSVMTLPLDEDSALVEGFADDADVASDCSGVIKEECLDWMRSVAEDGTLCLSDAPKTPEACSASQDVTVGRNYFDRNNTIFASQIIEDEDDRELHSLGDTEAYDRAIRYVYVGMMGFAQAGDDGNPWEPKEGGAVVEGAYRCLRANQFEEGSRTIEEVEDAAAGMSVSLGMTMLVAGAAVGVLL